MATSVLLLRHFSPAVAVSHSGFPAPSLRRASFRRDPRLVAPSSTARRRYALSAIHLSRSAQPVFASSAATSSMHTLPDGKRLEVISMPSSKADSSRPPLLFVHGSYHAAWCWQENFLPYFSSLGYDCHAISLRAQGGSDPVEAAVAGTVANHAKDIASFVASLEKPPVVISHSFGGLPVQWYANAMEDPSGRVAGLPELAGLVFMASVPQTGNKQIVSRYFFKSPVMAMKITWWFIRKSFATSAEACRTSFFSDDLPESDLLRFMEKIKNSGTTRMIDLQDMNKIIPLPPPPAFSPPALVMGAETDKVVDMEAVEELASNWKVSPVILDNIAHDMMLDSRWEEAASVVADWLGELPACKAK